MSETEEIKNKLSELVFGMTPEKMAYIKSDPEILSMWKDSSTILQAICHRLIALGYKPELQREILVLDEMLQL